MGQNSTQIARLLLNLRGGGRKREWFLHPVHSLNVLGVPDLSGLNPGGKNSTQVSLKDIRDPVT